MRKFIEDNRIVYKENIWRIFEHRDLPTYRAKINGYEIHVLMENYLAKGEVFLKNAYLEIC